MSSPVRKLLKPYMTWNMGSQDHYKATSSEKADNKKSEGLHKSLFSRWLQKKHRKMTGGKGMKAAQKGGSKSKLKKRKYKANDQKGLVEKFEKAFFATTTCKPRESRRRTVKRLLKDECPGIKGNKFGVESLSKLAALLQHGGYKACKPYIIEAKMMHLDAGGEWSLAWDRKFKLCIRAATRDKGPAKKAAEVQKEVWCRDEEPVGIVGREHKENKQNMTPSIAKTAFAVAVHWMLREIELSELRHEDVAFDVTKKMVKMTWKKSKMDPEARGVCRVLQCTCADKCGLDCPYEATWRLVHGEGKETMIQSVDGGYVVKTIGGKKARKCDVIKAWKKAFGEAVTGHSPRRSGALQYIRAGWTVAQVAFLGRWRSQVIYEYAREALETVPVPCEHWQLVQSQSGRERRSAHRKQPRGRHDG